MYADLLGPFGLFFDSCTILWILVFHAALGWGNDLQSRTIQPAQGDLCHLYQHRSALLGNRLYFMGGAYTFQRGDTTGPGKALSAISRATSNAIDRATTILARFEHILSCRQLHI